MRPHLYLLIVFAFLSCTMGETQKEPFKTLLKDCDQIEMTFFNGGDTLHFNTKDSAGIRILVHSISGLNHPITALCAPDGALIYKAHEQVVLNALFSTSKVDKKSGCDWIIYQWNNTRYFEKLPAKAEKLLDQLYTMNHKPA